MVLTGRRGRPGQLRASAVLAGLLGAVLAAGVALAGCGSASKSGLVGFPSYLPKATLRSHGDALVVGTTTRPALTDQGDTVRVVTPNWSVLAVVNGPEVPGEGLPYQAPATTCTWTVTLSHASGQVPISALDFDSIDDRGNLYHPYLVPGLPAPPARLGPHQTVSFELRAVEAVGEGLMRWAPTGGQVVAKWDFVVEND